MNFREKIESEARRLGPVGIVKAAVALAAVVVLVLVVHWYATKKKGAVASS